jgi:hypothetical protein
MARPKKYANGEAHCFHVDREVYAGLKQVLAEKVGRSVSEEINEFMVRRLAELKGEADKYRETLDYEALKRRFAKVVDEVEKLSNKLRRLGYYEDLKTLAFDLGLDFSDLHNLSEIAPKILAKWDGPSEYAHLFISLAETAKEKRELEKKLKEIRLSLKPVDSSIGG